MKEDLTKLSVRSASWVGAQCVRTFCATHDIKDSRVDAFVNYIELIVEAPDVAAWDQRAGDLEINGLGACLPQGLSESTDLYELFQTVHEISASQIYGVWQPEVMAQFLKRALEISAFDPTDSWSKLRDHDPENDGWGKPFPLTRLA